MGKIVVKTCIPLELIMNKFDKQTFLAIAAILFDEPEQCV